jgi:hypothetical protein
VSKEFFLDDPIQDRLLQVSMRLAQELYVTQDRLRHLEHTLKINGVITDEAATHAEVALAESPHLDDEKYKFVERILAPIIADLS